MYFYRTVAILLIDEIHEIKILIVNGISYTLLIESTSNLVLVGRIMLKDGVKRTG